MRYSGLEKNCKIPSKEMNIMSNSLKSVAQPQVAFYFIITLTSFAAPVTSKNIGGSKTTTQCKPFATVYNIF